jgi:hypothetical protein
MNAYKLDTPLTLTGYVKTANLLNPTSSLTSNEQFNITVYLEDLGVEYELATLFGCSRTQAPYLSQNWRDKEGEGVVTLHTTIKPRVARPEGLDAYQDLPEYTLVSCDYRAMLQELNGTDLETLVLISVNARFVAEPEEEVVSESTLAIEAKYGDLNF